MKVIVREICEEFDLILKGNNDHIVTRIDALDSSTQESLLWTKLPNYLGKVNKGAVICYRKDYSELASKHANVTYLLTDKSPRLMFAKIVQNYFGSSLINLTNEVEKHKKNKNIEISENCFIGPDVEFGDGTVVYPNVVIHTGTKIGKNCIIKSFTTLGTEGLGFEMDEGKLFKFPQLGGVVLGNDIEIGPSSSVKRGAIKDTTIANGCKIGSFVNIGHNCQIGENCILTAQVVTSGSSVLGANVFVGVNSSIKQKVKVGNNAVIGHGSVIIHDINPNEVVAGNPGKVIKKN
jgi:UDP-3-O-[3-hydroxymyristoyl] glucosamine N-acyltransferase